MKKTIRALFMIPAFIMVLAYFIGLAGIHLALVIIDCITSLLAKLTSFLRRLTSRGLSRFGMTAKKPKPQNVSLSGKIRMKGTVRKK